MNKSISGYLLSIILAGSFFVVGQFFNSSDEVTMNDFIQWKIEKKKHKKPTHGMPDKAMKWYYDQRAYPQGFIPANWREKALNEIKQFNLLNKSTAALSWTQLGPGNIGGRIRTIVVHPTDPNTVYLGSVGGGVWKTTTGGTSWFPLKDNMENLAVCSMVMDPTNPNVLYAGTGEGFFNGDAIRGEGIFKTTDAGSTWTRLSTTNNANFYFVNKLVIDPSTNILYAGTRKGLFRSTDGGTSFTGLLLGSGGSDVHCMDIEIAGTTPSTIYASFGLLNDATIYRSNDGGTNFMPNLSQSGHGRIEIATSASSPLTAIASFCDLSTNGVSLMAFTSNGGDNWFTMTVPGPAFSGSDNYAGTQAWYDNIIYIDPNNSSTYYAGGLDFWKSTNSGSNWTQKTNWYSQSGAPQYVHADQHAIAFAPSNTNIMFLGTDGGIFKSTNKGENWTAINNNLFITQFYYGAVNPTGTTYYGGTQDNGTLKSTGSANWTTVMGGDGGATEVDFSNTNNLYMEYVNLAFFKSTNGGSTFSKSMTGIPVGPDFWDGTTDRTLFISPFSMDPNNSNTIVAGSYRVWRTTNSASSWTAISGDLTGDGTGDNGNTISTVVVAKGNSNVIYAGCSNGRVQVTTDGGATWNLRNSGLPVAYCTRIATEPNNPSTAYATFSGFTAGSKVYKTTNFGVNWTNISSNLPNIPVSCIVVNPSNTNNIFIGTDLGVFSTVNSGSSWVQDNNGLANVSVADLDFRASDNKLFAATHGRGMFSTTVVTSVKEIDGNIPNEFELSQNYPNPFNPTTSFKYSLPEGTNVKVVVYDLNGKQVAELVNSYQNAGTYEVTWNGKNFASGVYIYNVQAGNSSLSKKMIQMK
ncbi:MAG: T9SS type A sorting domain-containing protein [Ignavibacteriaceae bacterium]|nr:T9SS type A sorting domain-containing protein [Ignavibacteriaceae bacterium]